LAEAVMQYAQSQGVELTDAREFEAVAGSGVQGYASDQLVVRSAGWNWELKPAYSNSGIDGISR